MPSLSMYLAIAKKYIEKHPEEDEQSFIEGIIAPDEKRNIKQERARLHYGESSHRPDLNRYYQEEGLQSSYNRGYFLNLITDYLFYNKFLNEYSVAIFHDFKRMNGRIEQKYDVHIPNELEGRVRYKDGDLQVLDEETVYKFIDIVSQLDLEKYYEQISEKDREHKVKFVGLKEGLLYKHNESNYFNTHDEEYFYGFENNYAVLVQRVIGKAETEGAREGLYQVSPYGIAVKPSKIMKFSGADIGPITEDLDDELSDEILEKCEIAIGRKISRDASYNLERISKEDVIKILHLIRTLPERTPEKKVVDKSLNCDYMSEEDIEIE